LKNTSKKVILVRRVALGRNSSRRHCGARSEQWCVGVIYRLSILVSSDVSQPIQKIIGISYLMSANTRNHIIDISCTMSTDTNNVSGIKGVTPPTQNPNFGLRHQAAQVSRPLRRRLPRCRVVAPTPLPTPPSASTPPAVPPSSSPTPVAVPNPVVPFLTPSCQPRCRPRLLPRCRCQCPCRRP
jgi:hypothetical protein